MENLSRNFQKKQNLIRSTQFSSYLFPHHVVLSIHGVNLRIYSRSPQILNVLREHYPATWFSTQAQATLDIFWRDSRELGWSDEAWESESDPDCWMQESAHGILACQRDFASFLQGTECQLICPYTLSDGFYNFLRWLLPLHFIKNGKMLLHSSCVIDEHQRAYFSLGYSGAGKSTIASLHNASQVLGDDMNVIKVEDGQCWAQAGALGQAILNPREYANWYPVRALFWLKKSDRVHLEPLSKTAQVQYLSTAVANVFWNQLKNKQSEFIFHRILEILQHVNFYELSFPKQPGVWNDIFSQVEGRG